MGQAVYDMTIHGTPNGVTTVRYQNIAQWTYMKRLGLTLELSLPLLGPDVAEEIKAILSPESLAIMAGVLVGWIASHAFGLTNY